MKKNNIIKGALKMNMNIKNRGFTIVELLVVIVVIGILAAITMVSYSGVTSKANTAANKSNAASVMQAADAYFAENGVYPTTVANLGAGSVKLPSNISSAVSVSTPVPSSTNPTTIGYAATSAGYCITYWDSSAANKATLATAGTVPTCL